MDGRSQAGLDQTMSEQCCGMATSQSRGSPQQMSPRVIRSMKPLSSPNGSGTISLGMLCGPLARMHPGSLRMFAYAPLLPNKFHAIGNILTQRSMRSRRNEVIVKLGLSGMANGQLAGLAHFAVNYCSIQVKQADSRRTVQYEANGIRTIGSSLKGTSIYLRSIWDLDGTNEFSFSENGEVWVRIGRSCRLSWRLSRRSDRVFTTNQDAVAGYIDMDSFQYSVQR